MKSRILRVGGAIVVGAFFIIATIVAIIFAQGRTLNQDGSITQTSIIQINSVPTDVQVYLDNQQVNLTDRKVEWVEPGIRNIKLTKSGYKDWQKDVKVEAGVVKEVYAQLYPVNLNMTKLTETNIDRIFYSDNSEFAYYTVVDNVDSSKNGLWRLKLTPNFLDFGTNSPILISNLTSYLPPLRTYNYSLVISADNNKLLLQIPEANIIQMIEVNRQNQDTNVLQLLGYYPDKIDWFRGSESLIVEKNNLLFEYEISSAQKSLVDFSFDDKLIYSVNTNYVLFLNSQDKRLYFYSNKFSIPMEDAILDMDLTALTNFYTVMGSSEIVILQFNDHLTYIHIEKEFKEDILSVSDVREISDNGRVILFDHEGTVNSYSLENTPDNLSFVSEVHTIDINKEIIATTYIAASSRTIIFKTIQEGANPSLISFDADGGNKTEILTDERIDTINNYIVSNDSTKLFLPLIETVSEGVSADNLFEIDLVIN